MKHIYIKQDVLGELYYVEDNPYIRVGKRHKDSAKLVSTVFDKLRREFGRESLGFTVITI